MKREKRGNKEKLSSTRRGGASVSTYQMLARGWRKVGSLMEGFVRSFRCNAVVG